jgi:hypothetical protein
MHADLDLPRRTVPLEEIDAVVADHYRIDPALLAAHCRSVGQAKSVALELAAQLERLNGRAVGEHYRVCTMAVSANRRRLATRCEVLEAIEKLARKLRKWKPM